jgi:NtrC-family two-component system sensor histidine kinase KinB
MASEVPEQARAKSSLELLYSISRELAAQLDLDKLLRRVLQLTMDATGPPNGSILILDEDGSITDGALAYDGKLFEHTAERLADTYRQGLAGWVVEHKQPALIPDTGEDQRWLQRRGEGDEGSPRSAVCVPLMARQETVGVLTLVHPEPDYFSEDDLDLLTAIAEMAGIAIANARLYSAERERFQFASTLKEIARTVNSTLDPTLVFPQVLEQLERLIHFDSASIYVLDGRLLRLAAARGFSDDDRIDDVTLSIGVDTLVGEVVRSRSPRLVPDVQNDRRWSKLEDLRVSEKVRAWIGAPLVVREKAVGVLCVDSYFPASYNFEDVEVVSAFADQAATAVANAQLFSESQRRVVLMKALAESGRVVSGSLNLDDVLDRIVKQTKNTLQAETVSIALINDEGTHLEFKVASGLGAEGIIGHTMKKDEGITGWTFTSGDSRVVDDVTEDELFSDSLDRKAGITTRALVCAPISVKDEIIGVLSASNPKQGRFEPEQVELLEGIASLAGTAIAQAQLFTATQSARQRYTSLFEDSIDPIFITNLDGDVIEANLRAGEFLGYSPEALIGRQIRDLHTTEAEEAEFDPQEIRTGEMISYEGQAWHHESQEIPIEVHLKCISIDQQRYLQWILHDISERRQLDDLRQDLTSMIFHDLRSPLGNVISSLEVMEDSITEDDETLSSILSIASRSSRRAARLVESLLDLGQLESGQAVLNKTTTSMGTLIAEAVEEVHPTAEAKGHMLRFELAATLPLVSIDSDMIRRVLINLLENAVKYTTSGGTVTIQARAESGEVLISVEDSGPGISPDQQDRIFNKFTRLDRDAKPKGLGLGLAFCRLAVEAHGGKIWVDSEVGRGSTFTFTLPV